MTHKTTLVERIQFVTAQKKNVTPTTIAEQTGITLSQISKWNLGIVKGIGRKNANILADYFGCDPEWLRTGEGEPFPPRTGANINFNFTQPLKEKSALFAEKIELLFSLHENASNSELSKIYAIPETTIASCKQGIIPSQQILDHIAATHGISNFALTDDTIPPENMFHFLTTGEGELIDRLCQESVKRRDKIRKKRWEDEEFNTEGMLENITKRIKAIEEIQNNPPVRDFQELAQLDADTLGEIQTWINEKEKLEPGFTTWFRHEFKNRFPEFAEWKTGLSKEKNKTGTDN